MPIFMAPVHSAHTRHSTPGLGYREPLANGEAGTAQTIAMMRKLVHDAMRDQTFVNKAISIVRASAAPFDDLGEVRSIYDWFKRNIRYTKDPTTVEKLYPPQELLKVRAGDCDDLSMGILAVGGALGYPGRFITISTVPENPSEFTHVYPELETPPGSGNWVALDTARIDSQFGLEPQIYFRKRAWDVASDSFEDLSGKERRHKLPKFLNGYVGLGQDDLSAWMPVIQQTVAETPALITAASGRGSATSPYGTVTNPYSSFQTPYSPGYGIPPAGYTAAAPYGAPAAGISLSPMTLMLIVGGILIFSMARK